MYSDNNDDTTTDADVNYAKAELLKAWRLLEPADSSEQAESDKQQEINKAIYELAQALKELYRQIDPEHYLTVPYNTFSQVTAQAFDLLKNPDAKATELLAMKAEVMKAWMTLEKNGQRVSIEKATIAGIPAVNYTGKEYTPVPKVSFEGKLLKSGQDYTLTYSNNKNAGQATVTITGIGKYEGIQKINFTIRKTAQSFTVKKKTPKVSSKKLKKTKKTISKVLTIKNAKGKISYTKIGGSKYLSINKNNGKITVKKGTGKGTYKIKIQVTAAGDNNYLAAKKKVTVSVKVK